MEELDPVVALVAIDLQKGIAAAPTVHPMADIVERTARLARAFRRRGLPVVWVNVAGRAPGRTDAVQPQFAFPPDFAELLPELDRQPGDLVVTKQRWGAFIGTELDGLLCERSVTQILLTGVATSKGVESTARSAFDLGYNVAFVTDAMTDREAGPHAHCVETMFPRMGETVKTDELLTLLDA